MEMLNGVATIKDGAFTVTGDNIGLTEEILKIPLTFKKSFFSNTMYMSDMFMADVDYPIGFLGKRIDCSDMKVVVLHTATAFQTIDITYTSAAGYAVEYNYIFTVE